MIVGHHYREQSVGVDEKQMLLRRRKDRRIIKAEGHEQKRRVAQRTQKINAWWRLKADEYFPLVHFVHNLSITLHHVC